jgi:hypothetical protein
MKKQRISKNAHIGYIMNHKEMTLLKRKDEMQHAVKIHIEIGHDIQNHQQKAFIYMYTVITPGLSYQLLTATLYND